jgi:hypothetical protein
MGSMDVAKMMDEQAPQHPPATMGRVAMPPRATMGEPLLTVPQTMGN